MVITPYSYTLVSWKNGALSGLLSLNSMRLVRWQQVGAPSSFTPQVKPLIWIESVIEKHSHSRIEYMVKVRVWDIVRSHCRAGTVWPW